MAFRLFFVLSLLIAVRAQILPARCNTINVQCVGEGGTCSADWNDENCGSYSSDWSLCQKCADDTLICHGGKCMKKTQGRGETCNVAQHLWCQPKFQCSGATSGTCQDPNTLSQPNYFAARGEACQQHSDCYGYGVTGYGVCDPYIHQCVNNNLDTVTQELHCYAWGDCLWDEYCSPQDRTTSPNVQPTCKKIPGGFGNRGGSLCKVPDDLSYPTGQCGWAQFCTALNQDEDDRGHTAYTATTCQQPYSIPEGGMCPPDINQNTVQVGNSYSNQFSISFCATGPCSYSGSLNNYHEPNTNNYQVGRCTTPDYTYAGTGCRSSDECGRGMTCACPPQGGGRQRCIPDNNQQNWELGRREWFDRLKPWLACLEANQCRANDAQKGSCGEKYCSSRDLTEYSHSCSTSITSPFIYTSAPSYRGYADTIGAAAHAGPSTLLLLSTILALLYALIH